MSLLHDLFYTEIATGCGSRILPIMYSFSRHMIWLCLMVNGQKKSCSWIMHRWLQSYLVFLPHLQRRVQWLLKMHVLSIEKQCYSCTLVLAKYENMMEWMDAGVEEGVAVWNCLLLADQIGCTRLRCESSSLEVIPPYRWSMNHDPHGFMLLSPSFLFLDDRRLLLSAPLWQLSLIKRLFNTAQEMHLLQQLGDGWRLSLSS
jgi:hypothetical protein